MKTFLPALKQANDVLEDDLRTNGDVARERYNIETIDQDTEKVIQMDLHCGVLEQKSKSGVANSTIRLPRGIRIDDNDEHDNYDDNDNDDDDDDEELNAEQLELRNQLLIQVLSQQIMNNKNNDENEDDEDDDNDVESSIGKDSSSSDDNETNNNNNR